VVQRNLAPPEEKRPQGQELLPAEELAKLWRTSARTIYRLHSQGMPGIRLGPRILRFDPEAIASWLDEQAAS
jgi:predicted DNA-binding transcriptional regulator AlpA